MRAFIVAFLVVCSLYCVSATQDYNYYGAYWLKNQPGLGTYEPGYFGLELQGPYSWTPFSNYDFGGDELYGVYNQGGGFEDMLGSYNLVFQVDDDYEGDDDYLFDDSETPYLRDPDQILFQVAQLHEFHGAARETIPDGSGRTFIIKQDCYLEPLSQEILCENYLFTEDGSAFDQGKNFYVQMYRDYDVGSTSINDVIVTDNGTPQVKVFQIQINDDDDAGQGAGIHIDPNTTEGCTFSGWAFGECCEALKPNTFSLDGSALNGEVCYSTGYAANRELFYFPTADAYGCDDDAGDVVIGMQVEANPGASVLSFQTREAMIWGYKNSNLYSFSYAPQIVFGDTFTFTDTIDVNSNLVITDVDVSLSLTHTFLGDLDITITSPAGTTITLFDNDCGYFDDILERFSDDGGDICYDSNPAAPVEPLSNLNGESSLGTWTLSIIDSAYGDSGTLNDWFLTINGNAFPSTIGGLRIGDDYPLAQSTIDVPDSFGISNTYVTLDMPHTFLGDLIIDLQSPAGTVITLHNQDCGANENIFETFIDGGGDICADENPVAPVTPLSALAGENAFGTWTLTINDSINLNDGRLNSWFLEFYPESCGNGVIEGTEVCDTLDHGLATCQSVAGLAHGQLACRHDCTFDTSHCSDEPFRRTAPGKNVVVMDMSYRYDDDDTVDGIGSLVQAERGNLVTIRNEGYDYGRQILENNLCGTDLLITHFDGLTDEAVQNIRTFAFNGGSVFVAGNIYYQDDDGSSNIFGISHYYNDYSWSGVDTPHIVKNIASGMTTGLVDMRGRDSALGFGYNSNSVKVELLGFDFGDSGISVVDLEDDYCANYNGDYCSVTAFQRFGSGYIYFNGASIDQQDSEYMTQQLFSSNSFIRNVIYNANGIAPTLFQLDDRPITFGIDFRNFADYCEGASVSLYRDGVLINTYTNPNGVARYVDNITGCYDYSVTYNAPSGFFFQQTEILQTFNFCGREVFEPSDFFKKNRNLSFLDCSNPDSRFERNLCESVNSTA